MISRSRLAMISMLAIRSETVLDGRSGIDEGSGRNGGGWFDGYMIASCVGGGAARVVCRTYALGAGGFGFALRGRSDLGIGGEVDRSRLPFGMALTIRKRPGSCPGGRGFGLRTCLWGWLIVGRGPLVRLFEDFAGSRIEILMRMRDSNWRARCTVISLQVSIEDAFSLGDSALALFQDLAEVRNELAHDRLVVTFGLCFRVDVTDIVAERVLFFLQAENAINVDLQLLVGGHISPSRRALRSTSCDLMES